MKRFIDLEYDGFLKDHQFDETPVFPLAVMLAEFLSLEVKEFPYGITDIDVETPILLRKNRKREFQLLKEKEKISYVNENNVSCVSGLYPDVWIPLIDSMTPRPVQPQLVYLGKKELYPDLLFHGPSFQADLSVRGFDSFYSSVLIRSFEDMDTSEKFKIWGEKFNNTPVNPILVDLALQIACMHSMVMESTYMIPFGISRFEVSDNFRSGLKRAVINIEYHDENGYYCECLTDDGKLLFIIHGLELKPLTKEIQPESLKLLEVLSSYVKKEI